MWALGCKGMGGLGFHEPCSGFGGLEIEIFSLGMLLESDYFTRGDL